MMASLKSRFKSVKYDLTSLCQIVGIVKFVALILVTTLWGMYGTSYETSDREPAYSKTTVILHMIMMNLLFFILLYEIARRKRVHSLQLLAVLTILNAFTAYAPLYLIRLRFDMKQHLGMFWMHFLTSMCLLLYLPPMYFLASNRSMFIAASLVFIFSALR